MKIQKFILGLGILLAAGHATAAPLKTAKVTKVVRDVKISENSEEAQTTSEGQAFGESSTMFTGRGSRAELTFSDQTISRIGSNSVFRLGKGSREMTIDQGSFLLQVPKDAGGATIRTTTVVAAITGTTTMWELAPGKWIKFITLEGEATLTNKKGKKIKVPAGSMLAMHPDAEDFPNLVTIDISKLINTSKLLDKKLFGGLSKQAQDAINLTAQLQLKLRRTGDLIPGGPAKYGPVQKDGTPNGGTAGTILQKLTFGRYQGSPGGPPDGPNGGSNGGSIDDLLNR